MISSRHWTILQQKNTPRMGFQSARAHFKSIPVYVYVYIYTNFQLTDSLSISILLFNSKGLFTLIVVSLYN